MSLIAKQMLVTEMAEILSDTLGQDEVDLVAELLTDTLCRYELERFEDEENSAAEFDTILSMFLDTKRLEGRSERTIDRYQYIVGRFRKQEQIPIKQVTAFNIRRWLAYEKSQGLCDNTLRGFRGVLMAFFGWCHKEGILQKNPCLNVGDIKCKKEVRLPYSPVDIEKLKSSCDCVRDKAILNFLLSTGCRISEVCGLNIDSIDLRNRECTVLGKGNKERVVYFDKITAMYLESYIKSRTDDCEALFIGKGTQRMHPGGIRKMLHQVADKAGVDNVHPHRFRRTLATSLIKHGMPIQEVASILGHDKIDTTMTYVYIDAQTIKNSYCKYA